MVIKLEPRGSGNYYELNKCGKRNIEEKQITENASV